MPAAAAAVPAATPAPDRLDTEASCEAPDLALAMPDLFAGGADPELHACVGKIQPGSRMTGPAGCTMNWIVRDSAGALYIGSAGHCASVGATVSISGVGVVGKVVYNGFSRGIDFLLVKIDPSKYALVDPTLCHWGGPSSTGTAAATDTVLVYGFGTLYGSAAATRARAGVALGNSQGVLTYLGTMQPGDSGAPVMSEDGEAVGIHVRSSLSTPVGIRVDPSPKYATRAGYAFADAGNQLGTTITLVPSDVPVNLLATI